jgi:hypothetical protein
MMAVDGESAEKALDRVVGAIAVATGGNQITMKSGTICWLYRLARCLWCQLTLFAQFEINVLLMYMQQGQLCYSLGGGCSSLGWHDVHSAVCQEGLALSRVIYT